MKLLKNKTAIITGGSGGIGSAIVEALYYNGYNVVIHYFKNSEKSAVLEKRLEKNEKEGQKPKILTLQADITDYEQAKSIADKTHETFQKIDILINNTGISKVELIENLEPEAWEKVIKTNLTSAFYLSKSAIPYLKKSDSGRIININSMTGFKPDKGLAAYTASKSGLTGLTKALSLELAKYKITVNEIAPGYIDAGMFNTVPIEIKEKIIGNIPLKRFGTPEDIAKAVIFLASDDAKYITGQTLHVNGGVYI